MSRRNSESGSENDDNIEKPIHIFPYISKFQEETMKEI